MLLEHDFILKSEKTETNTTSRTGGSLCPYTCSARAMIKCRIYYAIHLFPYLISLFLIHKAWQLYRQFLIEPWYLHKLTCQSLVNIKQCVLAFILTVKCFFSSLFSFPIGLFWVLFSYFSFCFYWNQNVQIVFKWLLFFDNWMYNFDSRCSR